MAVYMLTNHTKEFKNAKGVDLMVDVGNKYDPSKNLYDHHQKEFRVTFSERHSIKLSSAGLIFKHFGIEIIANILGQLLKEKREEEEEETKWGEKEISTIYFQIYQEFFQPLDAIDNGINQYLTDEQPLWKEKTGLSSRISYLNPPWNEKYTPEQEMRKFKEGMEMAGIELRNAVKRIAFSWLPANILVRRAILSRFKTHESGKIMELCQFCPWKAHYFELEKEFKLEPKVLYVIFTDPVRGGRVQCVPVSPESFTNRKSLPILWQGLEDEKLSEAAKIKGCVFVHSSGFIGGHKTRDGAIQMAVKALEDISMPCVV